MSKFVKEDDCPHCGYSGLHYRMINYHGKVVVMYRCALCKHEFTKEHDVRD